jgi:hypothetical protein
MKSIILGRKMLMITLVSTKIGDRYVGLTTPYHVRKQVNAANEKEILTSNFYYDIINEKPYLSGDEFVIKNLDKTDPEVFKDLTARLREAGVIKKAATGNATFLTEAGVFNILYAYGIEPKSLLQGGPKIPMVQNSLFGQSTPSSKEVPETQKKANALFPPTEKKKRTARVGGRLTRLHKPGVNIGDETTPKLINLSKPLMPLVVDIPHIKETYDRGLVIARADMTVGQVGDETLFGIKFHEDGDYEFTLKRVNVDEIGIQNISIDKKTTRRIYDKAYKFLKRHKLLRTALFEPQIAGDTIMFTLSKGE